ncbi:MAG: FkbM family methyltransferase [Candidatus Paceibacterota bacterium]
MIHKDFLIKKFEKIETIWRRGRWSQLMYNPVRVFMASCVGRISNIFYGGDFIFPQKRKMFFGSTMTIPVPLCADMWKFGAFLLTDPEIRLTKFLLHQVKDNEIFFDVGAHIGYYSCLIAEISKDSRVYAFEPDPHTLVYLRKNKRDNMTIVEKAVSEKNDVVSFFSRPLSGSWISTLVLDNFDGTQNEDAPFEEIHTSSVTLDSFSSDHVIQPTLIKIDVEGAESLVLRGAEHILAQEHLVACIEIRFRPFSENYSTVLEFMQKNGFSMFSISHDGSLQQIEYSQISKYFLLIQTQYDRIGDVSDFDNIIFIK